MKSFIAIVFAFLLGSLGLMHYLNNSSQNLTYSDRLAEIARKVNKANVGWTANENMPSDVTKEHFQKLCGLIKSERPEDFPLLESVELGPEGVPDSFDSRVQWPDCLSIKEVRDQSSCGSCWAFGAVETMSDRICIASDQKIQTRISSADLMECCHSCGDGCDGGYLYPSFKYWKTHGIVTGDLYGDDNTCKPYPFAPCAHHVTSETYPPCPGDYNTPSCKRQCNPSYGKQYESDKHYASRVYALSGHVNIKHEVATNGPVETAFTVYEDFVTYKSGVYRHTTGGVLGGHAVKILGYGTENGDDYWLIANSWNETWGDKGYFKILRGVNECGVEDQVVAGIPK